jgi:hypothetical protein
VLWGGRTYASRVAKASDPRAPPIPSPIPCSSGARTGNQGRAASGKLPKKRRPAPLSPRVCVVKTSPGHSRPEYASRLDSRQALFRMPLAEAESGRWQIR